MQNVSLAIVGAGEFGRRYVQSLQELSGIDIRWICDHSAEKAQSVADGLSDTRITTDLTEVCADKALDAVIVVTPENAHRVVAEQALQAGKHVIVEKPLATTAEDAQALVDAAKSSGKLLMTAFLLRFDYRYARLQQQLTEIGTVRNVYAYRNFDRSLFALYSRTHSFLENAIHDIDLVLWYVQSRVKKAHGFCRNTLGRENPDVNWGVLEFENDAIAVVQTSWLYPPQAHERLQWNTGVQVMGDQGVLEVRFDSDGFRASTENAGQLVLDQTGWATIHDEPRGAFGAMLRHFIKCLRGESEYCGTTPEEAMESLRVATMLAEDSSSKSDST
ncbi:Gfo/Idh/MocA family protein [Bythopirellula goksoeyrii]|uniref:Inositol 2-dehydrogenase n=1 Tax=Bythopirellula goksoeyrii TaxID=1400387 RepID=A0A5B9QMB9_9BACT|nr:Gfo/Idh/MocA family oxidoreductase [Bythopirellula goksoeyrii]QEG35153.1 Inositol 2-dehydrogenase [Bythopirellula goksoeyrii]